MLLIAFFVVLNHVVVFALTAAFLVDAAAFSLVVSPLPIVGGRSMPHLRKPEKWLARRDRALQKGFLKWVPDGHQWLLVPSEIAGPAKVITRGLAEHVQLDKASGVPHHHLAHAALAAKSVVGEERCRRALALNKACGNAKHGISRTVLSASSVPDGSSCPPPAGGACVGRLDQRDKVPRSDGGDHRAGIDHSAGAGLRAHRWADMPEDEATTPSSTSPPPLGGATDFYAQAGAWAPCHCAAVWPAVSSALTRLSDSLDILVRSSLGPPLPADDAVLNTRLLKNKLGETEDALAAASEANKQLLDGLSGKADKKDVVDVLAYVKKANTDILESQTAASSHACSSMQTLICEYQAATRAHTDDRADGMQALIARQADVIEKLGSRLTSAEARLESMHATNAALDIRMVITEKFGPIESRIRALEAVSPVRTACPAPAEDDPHIRVQASAELLPRIGEQVYVDGLKNDSFNRRFGTCDGFEPSSGRVIVSFWHDLPAKRILPQFLIINADCPRCGSCLGGRTFCGQCRYGDHDGGLLLFPRPSVPGPPQPTCMQ